MDNLPPMSKDLTGSCPHGSISTPPVMTSLTRGVTVANKSPNQHNTKKVGKSLKEKRNDKHAKKEIKKHILGE
jgi:hypothetical protein